MENDALREQISTLEANIEELADALAKCRKFVLVSKAAIAIGGVLIIVGLFGTFRVDPAVMIGALAAVIGGTVLLGSNSSTSQQTAEALRAAEAQRAELIGRIDLQVVAGRES
jgi:hypothetical protein